MRAGKQKESDMEVSPEQTPATKSDIQSADGDGPAPVISADAPPDEAERDAGGRKDNDGTADGDGDGDGNGDDDSAGDGAAPKESSGAKDGESNSSLNAASSSAAAAAAAAGTDPATQGWQAIWDSSRSAYYFWHAETNTSTWENPYEKAASPSLGKARAEGDASQILDRQLGEIDPELAFLDPSLAMASSSSRKSQQPNAYVAAAHFDPRSGRFLASTPSSSSSALPSALAEKHGAYQDPSTFFSAPHRAKRQMDVFFDSEAWENERAARALELDRKRRRIEQGLPPEEGGKGDASGDSQTVHDGGEDGASSRLTKKDIKAFKAKRQEQKKKKLDWLRS
ncbi:unnamed protein product [Tilletia controversa]|uniref:WW domain-containing protein n=3 Tax=Tilletia TaxID=13289 RepID=A0A8X7SXU6_9BASI|nr:hypothetical protein CF336_g3024 [Tilletia laevis]KAE8248659.1 hypothetical protein A4X06_0g3583 [Tilletia controversa]KAE8263329.1 hypothetical protein A4X03_0g1764 [Tilletia caries]KAE8206294.1 hypothetical protein CF335_g2004 [Tilletia laevis]CAD6945832.1 unnamed protein product [Tilletia controversa]